LSNPIVAAFAVWGFWGLYVLVMGLYRAHLQKRLSKMAYVIGAPFLVIGLIVDVFMNVTVASFVFVQPPSQFLVTQRLAGYVSEGSGWRYSIANWICNNLLDVFDPSGNHC
jgi:hypothetical protein